jgi:hypothetical protein
MANSQIGRVNKAVNVAMHSSRGGWWNGCTEKPLVFKIRAWWFSQGLASVCESLMLEFLFLNPREMGTVVSLSSVLSANLPSFSMVAPTCQVRDFSYFAT